MSALITVQLDAVAALAAELAALAAELAEDPSSCRRSAAMLDTALEGRAGPACRAAVTRWAAMVDVIAEQVESSAATLSAAVESYRALDAGLGERIGLPRPGLAVPR